jgi:zinc transport system substrate-binding protein
MNYFWRDIMFKKKKFYLILFSVLLLLLSACNNTKTSNNVEQSDDNKLTIMTSIYPLYDFASKIAGDRAEVINLVPAGAEPHDFEPTPKDMATLSKANLFIYNGGGYETWIEDVLSSIDQPEMSILNVSENLDLLTVEETGGEDGHDHGHGEEANHGEETNHVEEEVHAEAFDPHVWLDPIRAKQMAEMIKEELIKVDEAGKDIYEKNFNELASEFDTLHSEYETALSNPSKKEVVVSHAAFGYLTNRYSLEQISISGITPSDEPSPKELQEIIQFAKDNEVKYILFETLVSPKVAETVQEKIGAKALTLNPLEGLTQQELEEGRDYFSVMRENLESLKLATGSES